MHANGPFGDIIDVATGVLLRRYDLGHRRHAPVVLLRVVAGDFPHILYFVILPLLEDFSTALLGFAHNGVINSPGGLSVRSEGVAHGAADGAFTHSASWMFPRQATPSRLCRLGKRAVVSPARPDESRGMRPAVNLPQITQRNRVVRFMARRMGQEGGLGYSRKP